MVEPSTYLSPIRTGRSRYSPRHEHSAGMLQSTPRRHYNARDASPSMEQALESLRTSRIEREARMSKFNKVQQERQRSRENSPHRAPRQPTISSLTPLRNSSAAHQIDSPLSRQPNYDTATLPTVAAASPELASSNNMYPSSVSPITSVTRYPAVVSREIVNINFIDNDSSVNEVSNNQVLQQPLASDLHTLNTPSCDPVYSSSTGDHDEEDLPNQSLEALNESWIKHNELASEILELLSKTAFLSSPLSDYDRTLARHQRLLKTLETVKGKFSEVLELSNPSTSSRIEVHINRGEHGFGFTLIAGIDGCGRTMVNTVDTDGPAYKSGLIPHDQIVKIDGVAVGGLPSNELTTIIQECGDDCTILLLRDNRYPIMTKIDALPSASIVDTMVFASDDVGELGFDLGSRPSGPVIVLATTSDAAKLAGLLPNDEVLSIGLAGIRGVDASVAKILAEEELMTKGYCQLRLIRRLPPPVDFDVHPEWFVIEASLYGTAAICGLRMIDLRNRGPTISWIEDDSPAYLAGIRENDEVICVNGTPAKNLSSKILMESLHAGPEGNVMHVKRHREVLEDNLNTSTSANAYHTIQIDPKICDFDLALMDNVVVVSAMVSGGHAFRAGLRIKDKLVEVDGSNVQGAEAESVLLLIKQADNIVHVTVWRPAAFEAPSSPDNRRRSAIVDAVNLLRTLTPKKQKHMNKSQYKVPPLTPYWNRKIYQQPQYNNESIIALFDKHTDQQRVAEKNIRWCIHALQEVCPENDLQSYSDSVRGCLRELQESILHCIRLRRRHDRECNEVLHYGSADNHLIRARTLARLDFIPVDAQTRAHIKEVLKGPSDSAAVLKAIKAIEEMENENSEYLMQDILNFVTSVWTSMAQEGDNLLPYIASELRLSTF